MKKTITILALLLLTLGSTVYAGDSLKKFYSRHRSEENVESIKLSRFLLALVPKDAETRALLRFLKSVRIFHMDALNERRGPVISELKDALALDSFESLLEVNEGGNRVHIYINQDAFKVRHMLIMVDGDNELVVLQARTNITFDQLSTLLRSDASGKHKSGLSGILSFKG